MNERIIKVRKTLKLSQQKFGEKIGITQGTLAGIEKGQANLTERNFESICRVFDVNPDWLRTGKGEMFKEKTFLDELAEKYELNYKEKALFESILELPEDSREIVLDWMLDYANKVISEEIRAENEAVEERRKLEKQKQEIENRIAELEAAEQAAFENAKKESHLGETG